MDALTILGIAFIMMLPNISIAATVWLGNKAINLKGANK